MRIVLLAKRHYTNRDALRERFGRIYRLPLCWHEAEHDVVLELFDYLGNRVGTARADGFNVHSSPIRNSRSFRDLWTRLSTFRPGVIIASGDCFIGLLALWLAKRMHARFVFDVYDDYRTFGAYRAFLGLDAYTFLTNRADMVWYASRALALTHKGSTPFAIVPNGIDPAVFHPADMAAARERTGLARNMRWIGYFGSMEPERGPQDLVDAVGLLHAQDPSVRLVLCGGGSRTRFEAPWVEHRGNVPHANIPDYINACDVVTLPYRRGPTIDMASSCKMAEYLFCRRPIVATDTPSLTSNFACQAHELGPAVCKPGDPPDLARALGWQLTHATIASVPEEHTWTQVAAMALSSLGDEALPKNV